MPSPLVPRLFPPALAAEHEGTLLNVVPPTAAFDLTAVKRLLLPDRIRDWLRTMHVFPRVPESCFRPPDLEQSAAVRKIGSRNRRFR